MSRHADRRRETGRFNRQHGSSGSHFAGLASRVLPLIVLAAGSVWWMLATEPAMGQFQNPTFSQPTYPQNGQGFSTSIPTIPSAAMQGPAEPAEAEAEPSLIPWEMPAIVTKIAQGGWLMIPLGICSLIVLTLSLERLVALRRGRVIPRPFVRRFTECVEDGQLSYDEATELCEEFDCPVAEVFRAAVRRWGRPMFEVEQAVMDAGDRVADGLKRFLRVFHAISNVAPLLGLLGTVLGMIEAFDTISGQESLGRPEMLASGISVALMTTAGGLSVAIPAYLAYMYFSSKSDSYLNEIDKLCQRVVDCISAEGLENANSNNRGNRKRRAA
jgi:biopolymer transport protein ExbB